MKKMNKKGFTLAELLIVVAIIAVLVAIAIPVFTAQLEKSREATDAANLRSAYAEIVTAALTDPATDATITVSLKQQTTGWTTDPDVAGVTLTAAEAQANGTVDVKYTASDGKIFIGSQEVKSHIS